MRGIMESGGIIRTEREKKGWSQKELGDRVGISQVAVMKIEAGTTKKSKHFPLIAQLLEIPLSRLDPALSHTLDVLPPRYDAKSTSSEERVTRSWVKGILRQYKDGDLNTDQTASAIIAYLGPPRS